MDGIPDSKVHVAYMGPTWVLSAPGGPHVGSMNQVIRDGSIVWDGMLNLGMCVITFSVLIQIIWVWDIIDVELNITLQVICEYTIFPKQLACIFCGVVLCFVVVVLLSTFNEHMWLIYPYLSGLIAPEVCVLRCVVYLIPWLGSSRARYSP